MHFHVLTARTTEQGMVEKRSGVILNLTDGMIID